jgi:hypothetical protein
MVKKEVSALLISVFAASFASAFDSSSTSTDFFINPVAKTAHNFAGVFIIGIVALVIAFLIILSIKKRKIKGRKK